MRERMSGIVLTVIILVLCVAFALWGIQFYLRGRGGLDTVAVVNRVKITREYFQAEYERARQRVMQQMGKDFSFDQQTQQQLRKMVLSQLIQSQAIYQEARNLGFRISQQQVDSVLVHTPAFQMNGQFSPDRFQQVLSSMLYSEVGFMEKLKQDMTVNQLQSGLIGTAFALPDEVEKMVQLLYQKRDIGYAIIPQSKFLASVTISDDDIQKYYQEHQDRFRTPEKVSIEYLELSADNLKTKVEVTSDEIKQFYTNNIDRYSRPERWQIDSVFVPVAKDASSHAVSSAEKRAAELAKQGAFQGKPNWIVVGEVPQDFIAALRTLKPGQVSAPIQVATGFYVLKLLQVKKAEVKPFNEVQAEVKKALIQQKTAQLFDRESDKLSDLTYTSSDTLTPAAKALGLKIQTTGLFTKDSKQTGILANPKVITAAFSNLVLEQKYNSNPIDISAGEVVVLRVKQHVPPAVKSLSAVKSEIKAQLADQAAQKKAETLGEKLLKNIQQGRSAKELVKQEKLDWKVESEAKRQIAGVNPQILEAAFDLPVQQANKPSSTGLSLSAGGYAIVQAAKVYPGSIRDVSEKQLSAFKRHMAAGFGQTDYALYTAELVSKAKIKRFDQNGDVE